MNALTVSPAVQQIHFVPGRGACLFTVQPGSGALIVDLEGLQRAVLFVPEGEPTISGLSEASLEEALSLPAFATEYCDPKARAAVSAACAEEFGRLGVIRYFPPPACPAAAP